MTIQKTLEDQTLTMVIDGRLDTPNTPQFEASLRESINGVTKLVLDFKDLAYISSSGLRVLLYASKVMNRQGEMVVCNANELIMEIFEITGFIDFLNIQ